MREGFSTQMFVCASLADLGDGTVITPKTSISGKEMTRQVILKK
jgi:hypothetical protein